MKIKGDELVIPISDLLTDETRIEICKQACFSELLAEFVCKTLVEGQCNWADDENAGRYEPWYQYSTGAPQAFELARQEVAKLADPITQKLVADLTKQRDSLLEEKQKLSDENFHLREDISDSADASRRLKSEVESYREASA